MNKKRAEEILDRFLDNEHVHDRWWDFLDYATEDYAELSPAEDEHVILSDVMKAAYAPAPTYLALFYHVWGTSLFEGDDLEVYQVLGILHSKNIHDLYKQCESVIMDKLDVYDRSKSRLGYQGMCEARHRDQVKDIENYPKGLLFAWDFRLYCHEETPESDSSIRQKRYTFAVYELKEED